MAFASPTSSARIASLDRGDPKALPFSRGQKQSGSKGYRQTTPSNRRQVTQSLLIR
jgi:hypothetical protein